MAYGGPRHYHGAGLGQVGKWICPGCGTEHVTRLEDGCSVCLARDASRETAVHETVVGVEKLAPYLLATPEDPFTAVPIAGMAEAAISGASILTEPARQSLAAALAHFVEHGSPDATLLPKAVMIGWARELAGLGDG